jgi:hypothetical protein
MSIVVFLDRIAEALRPVAFAVSFARRSVAVQ